MAAVPSIGRAAGVEPQQIDASATQELYERYSAQIYGFCVNRLSSRVEAEDATQSTFLNAHRALQRGVTPEAELAWLFKIAHNVCLTRQRSSRRRNRIESPSDLGAVQDVLPAPARDTSHELFRLTDALSNMPDNQRRAILLREWQGLSYHEIADDLNVTQSAVETLIFRARRALAANLELDAKHPRLLARVRKAFDVGTLLAALKTLFVTSTAVKATAAAVAVTGAVVVATSPDIVSRPAPDAPAVVAKAPATAPAPVVSRRSTQVEHRVAAVLPERAAAAPAKPRAASGVKSQPPGQARKAAVVAKKPKTQRQRPVVSNARPVAKAKAVKAKPVAANARPAPPKAARPTGSTNGQGKGNGKGQSKKDG
jgi:RNA polymerase sigma factor (sigma-70 family)